MSLLDNLDCKLIKRICPEASYNGSVSFWAGHFSTSLLENLDTSICMISGFVGPPCKPLFVDLNKTKLFGIQEHANTCVGNMIFEHFEI